MNILAFAGSLRKASLNKALLRAASNLSPDGMSIEIFDLEGIPLFNADLESDNEPDRIAKFKDAIRQADGILIASPEYNHGMTGVTKNAVDWGSRPAGDPPLAGKPVGVLGASPGVTGTARSQDQLRQCLKALNSRVMPAPELLVFRAKEKFDKDRNLTDEKTLTRLKKYLGALTDWIEHWQTGSQ